MIWRWSLLILLFVGAGVAQSQAPGTPVGKATPKNQTPKNETPNNRAAPASDEELNLEAYIDLLRTDVRTEKSRIMGQVMELDAAQAAVFWPIYKDFEADLTRNMDQVAALIKKYAENYETMTGEMADQLATKLLDVEQERNAIKRKSYEHFKTALNPITAARFLQVENQIEKLIDLEISAHLPVITDQGGK